MWQRVTNLNILPIVFYITVFCLPIHKKIPAPFFFITGLFFFIDVIFNYKFYKSSISFKIFILSTLPLFIFTILSFFYTNNYPTVFTDIEIKLSFLLMPFLYLNNRIEILSVFKYFILGCITVIILSLLYAIYRCTNNPSIYRFFYTELTWNHPSYLAMYVNFALCILLILPNKFTTFINKYRIGIVIFFICFIILLNSKAGLLSLVVSLAISIIFIFYKKKQVLFALLFMLCLALFGLWQVKPIKDRIKPLLQISINDSPQIESSHIRLLIWENIIPIIKRNWLLGIGNTEIKENINKEISKNNKTFLMPKKYNAHNQYLQMCLANGIILLVYFLFFLFTISQQHYFNSNRIAFLFVAICSVHFMFESMLEVQAGVTFFSIFSNLFMIKKQNEDS